MLRPPTLPPFTPLVPAHDPATPAPPHSAAPAGVMGWAKIWPPQPFVRVAMPPLALAWSQSSPYHLPSGLLATPDVSKSSHILTLESEPSHPGSLELKYG